MFLDRGLAFLDRGRVFPDGGHVFLDRGRARVQVGAFLYVRRFFLQEFRGTGWLGR